MTLRLVVSLCLSLLAFPGTPRSPQAPDLDALLAMKAAPGVEALLIAHARDGRVGRRWRALLRDTDPRLRLSAARALGATGVRSASPDLLQALAREREAAVTAELLQAIAIVAPDDAVAQTFARLADVDRRRADALLDGLAAARPALMSRQLLTTAVLRDDPDRMRVIYERLARSAPAEADRIDAALAFTGETDVVRSVLIGAAAARHRLPPALVQSALRSDAGDRLAAATYLAATYHAPGLIADAEPFRSAAAAARPSPAEAADPVARWADAIVARWLGDASGTDVSDAIAALPRVEWIRATPRAVLAVLSARERAAFAERFALSASAAQSLMEAGFDEPPADPIGDEVRVLTDVPVVMLEDLNRITGCQPQAGDERFASVRYRADRRPEAINFAGGAWSPGCDRVAYAVTVMAYGTPPRGEADRVLALVRLDAEFAACLDDRAPDTTTAPGMADGATAIEPRKVQDRRPVYPDVAARSRLQGVVGVEARIERSGCVSDARVVHGVHPYLDTSAVQAVSHWRYAPTLLNGVPVPIIVTVTTTFSLRPPDPAGATRPEVRER